MVIGLSKTFNMSPNNIYLIQTTMIKQPSKYIWMVAFIALWCSYFSNHNDTIPPPPGPSADVRRAPGSFEAGQGAGPDSLEVAPLEP